MERGKGWRGRGWVYKENPWVSWTGNRRRLKSGPQHNTRSPRTVQLLSAAQKHTTRHISRDLFHFRPILQHTHGRLLGINQLVLLPHNILATSRRFFHRLPRIELGNDLGIDPVQLLLGENTKQ